MKKYTYYKVGLFTSLLGFGTLTSCVNTKDYANKNNLKSNLSKYYYSLINPTGSYRVHRYWDNHPKLKLVACSVLVDVIFTAITRVCYRIYNQATQLSVLSSGICGITGPNIPASSSNDAPMTDNINKTEAAFFNQNQITMHKKPINSTLLCQFMVTLTLVLSLLLITGCGGIDGKYGVTLKTLSLRHNVLRSSQRINRFSIDPHKGTSYIDALREAAYQGDIDKIKSLCNKHQHNINAPITDIGETLLHIAVDKENMNVIKWLLRCKEIDINCQKNDGHTALHRAAYTGSLKIVEKLLRRADINWLIKTKGVPSGPGYTALELARLGSDHLDARLSLTTLDDKNKRELLKEINKQDKVIILLERLEKHDQERA